MLDLEKAADFLTRAGNYAALESHPDAVRLGYVLAKSVLQRFRDQPGATAGEIAAFAVESSRPAAVGPGTPVPDLAESGIGVPRFPTKKIGIGGPRFPIRGL